MPNWDGYPDAGESHREIDELLREAADGEGWHRRLEACSSLQKWLLWPRPQQARLVLDLLVRALWNLESRGPEAVSSFFLLCEVVKRLLSRKLPWTEDQLTALVVLTASPRLAQQLGGSVVQQVRWWGRPSEPVRRALKRLKRSGKQLSNIEPLLRRHVLLPPTDSPLRQRALRRLMNHARKLPDRVSKRWRRKGRALMEEVGWPWIDSDLCPWLAASTARLHREHPRLLRGLVTLLGEVQSDSAVTVLERVVRWGYQRIQGHGPQARRLAGAAIRSLGWIGNRLSVATLVALGSELRYPSATESLLKALRSQSKSLHTLVEVETADWDPDSEMGRRLWRSHSRRLERCLRTGREWSLEHWLESYERSRLLGAMARRLVWSCGESSFAWGPAGWADPAGKPFQPWAAVKLWHPVESKERWSLQGQPFPQTDREVFESHSFSPAVLRQHKFAALARQRDWHYRLVGRFGTGRGEALLQLAGCRVRLEVERAQARGPFSSEGIAVEIRVVGMDSDPPCSQLPPRIRSEAIRDLHLFLKVAGSDPAF